jgi:cell division protein ZapE
LAAFSRVITVLTPQQRYEQLLERREISADAAQRSAVDLLEDVYGRLLGPEGERESALGQWWRRVRGQPVVPVTGLYLWGGVGRGKTFLMDLFYDSVPFDAKVRMHFHRFMHRVHRDLRELAGTANPLSKVADALAGEARVLCFDEFFVADIADAMILGELLGALFARGVTLIATSNISPDGLYENGLQRSRFLPAIELLKTHTRVTNVDGSVDYRLRLLERAEIFHAPLDDAAEESLARSFTALVPDLDAVEEDVALEIERRTIYCRRSGDDVAWFDFAALCDGPRSQNDYIELARIYHAVLLSDVPVFSARLEDQARRFISLVDEFYDRNVKLILSAAAPIEDLYQGSRLGFEFQRTESRLLEMQSYEYLGRSHKP